MLHKFEKVSGLRLNLGKTEAMWIGSKRNSKDTPMNVKWPKGPIKVLGIFLTYDCQAGKRYNFDQLISM